MHFFSTFVYHCRKASLTAVWSLPIHNYFVGPASHPSVILYLDFVVSQASWITFGNGWTLKFPPKLLKIWLERIPLSSQRESSSLGFLGDNPHFVDIGLYRNHVEPWDLGPKRNKQSIPEGYPVNMFTGFVYGGVSFSPELENDAISLSKSFKVISHILRCDISK